MMDFVSVRKRLLEIAEEIQEIGVDVDYYGGFSNKAWAGIEIVKVAHYIRYVAEGMNE